MASRLKNAVVGITALGVATVGYVGGKEGLRLNAYEDVVGVATACYGETLNVRLGMKFTKPQCDQMFLKRLVEFETGMRSCLKAPDIIPDKPYVAFLSLSYNIGTGGFCRSSVARLINVGDIRGACDAMLKFNRAGGVVWPGLTTRRQSERKLCLEGLK